MLGGMSPQTRAKYSRWTGGGGIVRGVSEEAASRMAGVASGEVERLTSGAGKAVWTGELAPGASGVAEEGLPFMAVVVEVEREDEDGAEDILCKARTGAGHAVVAKGRSKGPAAARADFRAHASLR